MTKFAGLVRGVGWRHRLSEAEVHELLQQVRIRLWQAQGTTEQISRVPASYVYRTAVSAVLDMMRRRRAQRTEQMLTIEDGMVASATADPERDLESSELVAQVTRAVDSIPLSRRAVVRMYLAGHPRDEIADLLGWSEAKTRNLLYRGLGDLRARLTEQGIGWETDG